MADVCSREGVETEFQKNFLETQGCGFLGQQAFEAFWAGEEKFVTVRHEYSRALGYSGRTTHCPTRFKQTPFKEDGCAAHSLCLSFAPMHFGYDGPPTCERDGLV